MAFDSGMLRCVCKELKERFEGGKVEKVLQPEKDEINLVIRAFGKSDRLLLSSSSNNPRICVTSTIKENPESAYMLCMLLRKHLTGARVEKIEQVGFERVVRLDFDTGDELGYRKKRSLYLEIMGRSSTLVFCDENGKILSTTRTVDLSANAKRKLLAGMVYELPAGQEKQDPLLVTTEEFSSMARDAQGDYPASRWLVDHFLGISPLVGRECVYLACGDSEATMDACGRGRLEQAFFSVLKGIKEEKFHPCLLYRKEGEGAPFEFSFLPIGQYGAYAECVYPRCASEAVDLFYTQRDRKERKKQHYNDVFTILKNARNRVKKKIALQSAELSDCDKAEQAKQNGDLIMQELYRIRRGDESVVATDYSQDPPRSVTVALDPRLSGSANAQRYYKEYAKKNTAKLRIAEQIRLAKEEEAYLDSVLESLERAESEADYSQIRSELSRCGYGKRGVAIKTSDKRKKARPDEVQSPGGFRVLVGRNNTQNDYITFEASAKDDVWFHAKDYPGSHVLLVTQGQTPPNEDLEFAARLAAGNSGAGESDKTAVDYTFARYVKKPSGARPGFVNYFKYTTVYVAPLKLKDKS